MAPVYFFFNFFSESTFYSLETFTLIFVLRNTWGAVVGGGCSTSAWREAGVPTEATRAKIKLAVIASQTAVFALRT